MATPGMIEAVESVTKLGIEPEEYALFIGVVSQDMDRWLESFYDTLEELYPTED